MKMLGLVMTRNGAKTLVQTLDNMKMYCDAVYVLDDRSLDETADLAKSHVIVQNLFSASPDLPQQPWFFSESMCRELLFRMAEFFTPDWVVQLDDDQQLEPAGEIRSILESIEPDVAGVRIPIFSVWEDPLYPLMVPLMSEARSMNGAIWRYYPDLHSGSSYLHNPRLPINIERFGRVIVTQNPTVLHRGWNTLEKRIERVDLYTSIDPGYEYNQGVPYDRGLLFGYRRNEIDQLIRDYKEKAAQHV